MAFIGSSGVCNNGTQIQTMDLYYSIDKPKDKAAFVLVWGDGNLQRACLPVATILKTLATHCKSIDADAAAISCHALATLLDCGNITNETLLTVLGSAIAVQIQHSVEHFTPNIKPDNGRSTSLSV